MHPDFKRARPIIVVLAIAAILYSIMNISSSVARGMQNKQRIEDLQAQVDILNQKRNQLNKTLAFQQSTQFVEQVARNQLNMAKADETIVIFPQTDDVLAATTSQAVSSSQSSPDYGSLPQWVNFFLN